jgi:hypothetical protein
MSSTAATFAELIPGDLLIVTRGCVLQTSDFRFLELNLGELIFILSMTQIDNDEEARYMMRNEINLIVRGNVWNVIVYRNDHYTMMMKKEFPA